MSDTPKKTIDEQILERLQALEVVVLEQRKELNHLRNILQREFDYLDFSYKQEQQKKHNCPKCGGSGFPEFVNENACTVCKGSGVI